MMLMRMQSFVFVSLLLSSSSCLTIMAAFADPSVGNSGVVVEATATAAAVAKNDKQQPQGIIRRSRHRRRKLHYGKGKGYGYRFPLDDPISEDDHDGTGASSSSGGGGGGGKEDKDDDNNDSVISSKRDGGPNSSSNSNLREDEQGGDDDNNTTESSSASNQDNQGEESPSGNNNNEHETQDVVVVIPSNKDDSDKDKSNSSPGAGDSEEDAQESDFNNDNDGGDSPASDVAQLSGDDSMLNACTEACAGRVYETDESVIVPFEYQLIIPADKEQQESVDVINAAVQEYLIRELVFNRCHEYMDPLILEQCPMDGIFSRKRRLLQRQRQIAEQDLQAVRGVGNGFTNELLEGCSTFGDLSKVCYIMEGASVIYLDEELAANVDHNALIEDIALMIYKSGILMGPFSEIQVNFKPPPGIASGKLEDEDRDPDTVGKKENLPISVSGIVILVVGIIGVSLGSGYFVVKRNKRKVARGMQLDDSFDDTGAPTRSSITKLSAPPALTLGSTEDRDEEQEEEPVFDTADSSNCDIGSPAQILADLQRQEHEETFEEMSYEVDYPSHVQPSIPDLRSFSPKVKEELESQHEGSIYMSPRSYSVDNTVQL